MGIWNGNGATEQSSVWAQGGHAPINTNTRRRGGYCSNSVKLLCMRTKDGLACVFAGGVNQTRILARSVKIGLSLVFHRQASCQARAYCFNWPRNVNSANGRLRHAAASHAGRVNTDRAESKGLRPLHRRCARGVPGVALRSRPLVLPFLGACGCAWPAGADSYGSPDRFRSESFCHCVDTVSGTVGCRQHGPMGGGHDAFRVGSHLPCRSRQPETAGQGRAGSPFLCRG
jgi:hypothetical protein